MKMHFRGGVLMHARPENVNVESGITHPTEICSTPPSDPRDLQERLNEILIRVSGANPAQITPEARLIEDIGIDSLGFYEILIEADACLGIKIKEEDLLRFRTVGDIQTHLRSLDNPDAKAI